MKRNKILSLFLILALFVSMVGIINVDTTYAAAKKKKISVKVTSYSENSVTIKWNKISKPDKGYAVFRNGKAIAHLGKKATSFTDTGLSSGASYNYQIKTFKVKKVKKKGKKVKKYTYKKKSNIVNATTKVADPMAYTIGDKGFVTSIAINMFYKAQDLQYYAKCWWDSGFSSYNSYAQKVYSLSNELLALAQQARTVTSNKYYKPCTSSTALDAGYDSLDAIFADTEDWCKKTLAVDPSTFGTLKGAAFYEYALKAAIASYAAYGETYENSSF